MTQENNAKGSSARRYKVTVEFEVETDLQPILEEEGGIVGFRAVSGEVYAPRVGMVKGREIDGDVLPAFDEELEDIQITSLSWGIEHSASEGQSKSD